MIEIEIDYHKHGIEKCRTKICDALFRIIGNLSVTVDNGFGFYDQKEVDLANKLLEIIQEELSEVLKK